MYKICMTFYLTLETSRIRCRECRKCKGTQASSYATETNLLFYQQRVQTDVHCRHQHCTQRGKTKIPQEATGSTTFPNGPSKQVSGRGIPTLQWLFKIKLGSIHCEVRLAQLPALPLYLTNSLHAYWDSASDTRATCLYQMPRVNFVMQSFRFHTRLLIYRETHYKRFNAATIFVLGVQQLLYSPNCNED